MSFGNFSKFEQVKDALNQGETIKDLSVHLNALAVRFAEISDEFRLLDDDEQQAKEIEFLQLQFQYHDLAILFITKLLDPLFISEPEHIENRMDAEPKASTESSSTDSVASEQGGIEASNGLNSVNDQTTTVEPMEEGATALDTSEAEKVKCAIQSWSDVVIPEQEYPPPPFTVYAKIMEPIFALKPITQVNEGALDGVFTAIINAGTMAHNLRYSIEHDAAIIIACVQRNLDATTQGIWLWQLKEREPTLNEFAEFLADLAKRIPTLSCPTTSAIKPNGRSEVNGSTESKGAVPKKPKIVCPRCEGPHLLHRCEQFRTLTLAAKVETVRRAKICANCFSPSHATVDCAIGVCKRCKTNHNSLLCPGVQRK